MKRNVRQPQHGTWIAVAVLAAHVLTGIHGSGSDVAAPGPLACFVIRTYRGHDATITNHGLGRLFQSLRAQTVNRWRAVILVLDGQPFDRLHTIVDGFSDQRIQVFAEWVGNAYRAKVPDGTWEPKYHEYLYNLTDAAIRVCPPAAQWVVVTNGDNELDPKFLQRLARVPAGHDIVALDFYSRYQRPTAEPCLRFASGHGAPHCKENDLRFCHTDLASVAWSQARLRAEDKRFGVVGTAAGSAEAADGLLAAQVVHEGWKVYRLPGRCLVHHTPNPQQCASDGHVWDDSGMSDPQTFGGECIAPQEADARLQARHGHYQVLDVNVTFDPKSFDYNQRANLSLKCMRRADGVWHGPWVFGRVCAARIDFARMPPEVPPHPWDYMLPPDLADLANRARAQHAGQSAERK